MSLSNSQYDKIMKTYEQRRLNRQHLISSRKKNLYDKYPAFSELDSKISNLSIACTKAIMDEDINLEQSLRQQIKDISLEKSALFASLNIDDSYLNPEYTCPDCQDTGYIDGVKCHCLKQASIDLLFSQSNLTKIIQKENFSSFSFDYYPDTNPDKLTGLTPFKAANNAYNKALNFVSHFDDTFDNLLLFGNTGLGKTFLTNCIAGELLNNGYSVIYFSAGRFFDVLANKTFGKTADAADDYRNIMDCDLLIIDDLGTEMTNSFTTSQFFVCLNDRLINRKSTVISTNLGLNEIADIYSERIFSRISDAFTIIPFFGQDIRIQKRIRGN